MFWLTDEEINAINEEASAMAIGLAGATEGNFAPEDMVAIYQDADKEKVRQAVIKFHKWQTDFCDGFCGIDRHDKCEIIDELTGEVRELPYRIPRIDCYRCMRVLRRELGL